MDPGDDEYDQYADASPSQYADASPSPSPPTKHTQFLDLTNGEGGERHLQQQHVGRQYQQRYQQQQIDPYADAEEEEVSDDGAVGAAALGGGGGGGGGGAGADILSTPVNSHSGGGGGSSSVRKGERAFDPSTPGKVVESGQEHTGRWTKAEHGAFLSALRMYGKEWKKVAAKVRTRTVVQTRTHAQKYFQKLAKAVEGGKADVTDVEMGVAAEARRIGSSQKKKGRGGGGTTSSGSKVPRQQSLTNAAHLISNLSHTESPSAAVNHLGLPVAAAPVSSQQHASFATPPLPGVLKSNMFPARHGFSSTPAAAAADPYHSSSAYGAQPSAAAAVAAAAVAQPTSSLHSSTVPSSSAAVAGGFSSMSITAPDHDAAAKRGKFPEPSPAACGKRKLAEIAAARMLAGVLSAGGGGGGEKPGGDKSSVMLGPNAMEDGTATPPPEEETSMMKIKSEVPAPPPQNVESAAGGFRKTGLSLQIVNPESLGISYEQQQKRRRDGQGSPQTPWEGELETLISEEMKKEPSKESNELPRAPEMDGFGSASSPHAVCGPGSSYGRNPLHKAVCDMDLSTLQEELSFGRPQEYFQRRDEAGYCPIHSACSLCLKGDNSSIATDIVRMLATAGADVTVCDEEGNTPLHWAARAGDDGTTKYLLLRNCPKDAKNKSGETPLHWALRAGRDGMAVASVLLENGAFPSACSNDFKRPIDVAADGYHDEEGSVMDLRKLISQRKRLSKEQRKVLKDAAEERKESRANLLKLSAQSRTLVLHHPECLEHIPKAESDWECPGRIVSILDRLNGTEAKPSAPHIFDHEITLSQEFDRAKLDLLSRVHSTEYLKFVNELSKDLERQHKELNGNSNEKDEDAEAFSKPPVVPFTPMVQRTMIKVAESSVKLGQHSDTSFSVGSLRAARRAAGAVQHAVDCRNAFCVVRPPGHHAGVNGLLDGGESCGFCIFNSVAAGAMHAISDERLLCERCAIVDIDVHHGNGTEEIVRKCHDPSKLFFFSIHLYDNESKGKRETKSFQYKFYPGTGEEDDVALNIINVPISPLWKDKEPAATPTASTHNTRTRARRNNQNNDGDSSEAGTPKVSDAENETARPPSSGTSSPVPGLPPNANSGRIAYRQAIQNRLLPALRAFNPDLILISAGFDACKNDVGNAKHEFGGKEKMGIDLEPEDYAWTTRKVIEIADICCHGRVVSVLEGGYGKTPARASPDPNQPLDKSNFSECALRHVHAMIDPYDSEARFSGRSGN